MFNIVDVLAVREAVERQRPVRRLICAWLMANTPREDIEEMLGISRWSLRRHLRAIRRSFVEMGFFWPGLQQRPRAATPEAEPVNISAFFLRQRPHI